MERLHKIPDDMPIFEQIKLLEKIAKGEEKMPEILTGQQALDILMNRFLGEDYYIVDPVSTSQGNSIVVEDIIKQYKYSVKRSFCIGMLIGAIVITLICILR